MTLEGLVKEVTLVGKELFGEGYRFSSVNARAISYERGDISMEYDATIFPMFAHMVITVKSTNPEKLMEELRLEYNRRNEKQKDIDL